VAGQLDMVLSGVAPAEDRPRDPAEGLDGVAALEAWCEAREALVYLWGSNPTICAARTHAAGDRGLDRWMNRRSAEEILRRHGYTLHGTQTSPDERGVLRKGKVYRVGVKKEEA